MVAGNEEEKKRQVFTGRERVLEVGSIVQLCA